MRRAHRTAVLTAIVLSGLLAAGCQQPTEWTKDLENGDYAAVRFCRAPGGMQPVVPQGDLERFVAAVAADSGAILPSHSDSR